MGCSSDDDKNSEQSLIGTWQLIESFDGFGNDSGSWDPVENGYKYEFTADNKFTSTRFPECSYGTYSLTDSQLTFDYGCEDFDAGVENPEAIFIESFKVDGQYMILEPTYLFCIEICRWKFKKIK